MATTRKQPTIQLQKAFKTQFEKLDGWVLNAKATEISKSIEFTSFINALAFVAKIAVHAEILDHHPTITLSYKTVTILLTTHDKGGLTKLDFELAKRIDLLGVHC
jgi:4a-hydroxytetrahydrobiopterin dehydratase